MSYKENWVCLNPSITYTPMLDFAQIDSTKPQSRKKMHLPNKALERDSRKKLNLESLHIALFLNQSTFEDLMKRVANHNSRS